MINCSLCQDTGWYESEGQAYRCGCPSGHRALRVSYHLPNFRCSKELRLKVELLAKRANKSLAEFMREEWERRTEHLILDKDLPT